MSIKYKTIQALNNKITSTKNTLYNEMSFIDYVHVKIKLPKFPDFLNSIESNLKFCKLKVIFQSPCKLNSLFHYKDSLHKKIYKKNLQIHM